MVRAINSQKHKNSLIINSINHLHIFNTPSNMFKAVKYTNTKNSGTVFIKNTGNVNIKLQIYSTANTLNFQKF